MHINELKNSKFLKRSDVGAGMLVTIQGVSQENVAKDGAPEELKWCVHFEETDKPLVLNQINGQLIAKALGSEESDDWTGKKIVLFDDLSVSFGGKIVGGIRVRAQRVYKAPSVNKTIPQGKPPPKPAPAPEPEPQQGDAAEPPETDDNLPF